jgi:hypothetical protein
MKATYKTANGRLMFEVTGETAKEVFARVADLQEIFEADSRCGCCNGADLRLKHRVVAKGTKKFDYYELECGNSKCRARFAFGQLTEGGGLFPKRKDKEGNWLPNRGWGKYRAESDGDAREDYDEPPPEESGYQR